jgi:hypothetical protein
MRSHRACGTWSISARKRMTAPGKQAARTIRPLSFRIDGAMRSTPIGCVGSRLP